MATTIPRSDLLAGLKAVSPALGKGGGGLPVYAGIRLDSVDGIFELAATDGDTHIVSQVPCAAGEAFSAIVPGATLLRYVDGLQGDVELAPDGNRLAISAAGASLHLHTLPEEDWPTLKLAESDEPLVLNEPEFKALERVAYAASKDDARPVLTAVSLHSGKAAATDSYRLASVDFPFSGTALVPVYAVRAMLKTMRPTATFTADNQRVTIANETTTLTVRQIYGTYPDWERLIHPAESSISVHRFALIGALERTQTLAGDNRPVRITASEKSISLELRAQDIGVASETLAAECSFAGEMAYNPHYLIEMLEAVDDEIVTLEITGPMKPSALRSEGSVHIIMPVRV